MPSSQRGDEDELFRSFNDELMRSVRGAVRTSAANIEDACAIAWSQFLRYQPDRDGNWRGWLFTVARHEAVNLAVGDRQHRHFTSAEEAGTDGSPEPVDPRPEPQLLRMELIEALELLGRVPERRREAARLRVIGLSYAEVAAALGISYTRVNALLAEARRYMYADVAGARAEVSRHPRVARLHRLEQDTPRWLAKLIGRPPAVTQPEAMLPWRRAALAIDRYRTERRLSESRYGLGERPSDIEAARQYDRVRELIAASKASRQIGRGRAVER
jgi:RNA polymerase sigma factor (sigma-70 family)